MNEQEWKIPASGKRFVPDPLKVMVEGIERFELYCGKLLVGDGWIKRHNKQCFQCRRQ